MTLSSLLDWRSQILDIGSIDTGSSMAISSTQLPIRFRNEIDAQLSVFSAGCVQTERSRIPDAADIPAQLTSEGKSHWFKIPAVTCVYIDMQNSTLLSAEKQDRVVARAYQLFTETAVRLLHAFDASYIDVRGDGAFGLFDQDQQYNALCAAVSFKTFSAEDFVPRIVREFGVDVGCHLGIDTRSVLVRRLGLRPSGKRTDRQNEVWAGRPINMAAKLASKSANNELLVSTRFYESLSDVRATHSCGCGGTQAPLWRAVDLGDDDRFDFSTAWSLRSNWCTVHGAEYCESLLRLSGARR